MQWYKSLSEMVVNIYVKSIARESFYDNYCTHDCRLEETRFKLKERKGFYTDRATSSPISIVWEFIIFLNKKGWIIYTCKKHIEICFACVCKMYVKWHTCTSGWTCQLWNHLREVFPLDLAVLAQIGLLLKGWTYIQPTGTSCPVEWDFMQNSKV